MTKAQFAAWPLIGYLMIALVAAATVAYVYTVYLPARAPSSTVQTTLQTPTSVTPTPVTPTSTTTERCYTIIGYVGSGQNIDNPPGSGYSGEIYAPNSVTLGPYPDEACVIPGTPVSLREGSPGGNINSDFIGWLGTGNGSYTGLGSIKPPYTGPSDTFEDEKFFIPQNYTFLMPPNNITEEAFFGSPFAYKCLPSTAYAPGNALAACLSTSQYFLTMCEGDAASGCPQNIGSSPTIDCGSGFSGVLCFDYGAIPADDPTASIEMPPFVSNSTNNGCFPSGLDGPYEGISNAC